MSGPAYSQFYLTPILDANRTVPVASGATCARPSGTRSPPPVDDDDALQRQGHGHEDDGQVLQILNDQVQW